MIKLLGVLMVPAVAFSCAQKAIPDQAVNAEDMPCKYETVAEWASESNENRDTFAKNRDTTDKNEGIKTLEEPMKNGKWIKREKKPLAKIVVRIEDVRAQAETARAQTDKAESVSGEEIGYGVENMFSDLDSKFARMYEIKEKLDENERESAKLWSEYYALKDVYDRALAKISEEWAEDNNIDFVPKKAWRR